MCSRCFAAKLRNAARGIKIYNVLSLAQKKNKCSQNTVPDTQYQPPETGKWVDWHLSRPQKQGEMELMVGKRYKKCSSSQEKEYERMAQKKEVTLFGKAKKETSLTHL